MNRRKMNISLWSLGLALLLVMAALVSAAGTSLARYRAETTKTITFTARPANQIRLGQLVACEDGGAVFDPEALGTWELADGKYCLTFAISNMIGEESFAAQDQQVSLRLVGTPGIWDGAETVKITLLMPAPAGPEEEAENTENTESTENTENTENTETTENPEGSESTEQTGEPTEPEQEFVTFEATATRISVDSPLYNAFGDGWVFSFLNEDGTERSWMLEGGMLSVLQMTLALEGPALTDPSLLQLQVIGE